MISSIIEDTIHHCQTELKQDRFCYTWNIVDFWNIYKFKVNLYSSKAENNFRFHMSPTNEKLNFFCWIDNNKDNIEKFPFGKPKNMCYNILFKANGGDIETVSSKHIHIDDKNYSQLDSLVISRIPYSLSTTLTIYFEFFIFVEVFDKNIYYSYKKLAPVTDTDILLDEEKPDSLVTFVIGQQRLETNKNLLCLKSKVFEAMFNDQKESTTNEIEITDTKYCILQQLVFFIKTGYLPLNLGDTSYNLYFVHQLFIAADKYDIQDLKLMCEQHLITHTTVENVVEHLKIAYLNNGKILVKYAKNFIKLYLKVIMDTPEFVTLTQMYPELLIEIITMQIDQ